ncbi:hypothetical protein [Haloferax sp. DFSO52]|uniref:hypothetical protein n=1 Tax=Haloferax sp. DFSO52 TaxID=3388505 RepID=UPI003A843E02
MDDISTLTGELAHSFAGAINQVDESIGENKTYGEGIGPHDENGQVDALVREVRDGFDGRLSTVKSDSASVRYPDGKSADLVVEGPQSEFCEVKLFRFQKANGHPSTQGFSKVFSPYQDRNPRSFIHDVNKLANAEIRASKTLLGIYYRPARGAGADITGREIAQKFAADVELWTDNTVLVDAVAPFSGLQHDVLQRGAILAWSLGEQPERFF